MDYEVNNGPNVHPYTKGEAHSPTRRSHLQAHSAVGTRFDDHSVFCIFSSQVALSGVCVSL